MNRKLKTRELAIGVDFCDCSIRYYDCSIGECRSIFGHFYF